MNKFELISVDMFQTLVGVNTRIPYIWEQILGDDFYQNLAEELIDIIYRNGCLSYR